MFYLPLSLFNFIARLNFFMPFSTILLFSLPNVFYFSPPQFLLFSPLLYYYSLSLSLESADMKTRCRCYRSVLWATRERSLRTRSCSRSLSRPKRPIDCISSGGRVYIVHCEYLNHKHAVLSAGPKSMTLFLLYERIKLAYSRKINLS